MKNKVFAIIVLSLIKLSLFSQVYIESKPKKQAIKESSKPDFFLTYLLGNADNLTNLKYRGLNPWDFSFFDDAKYLSNSGIVEFAKKHTGITNKEDLKKVLYDARNRYERFRKEAFADEPSDDFLPDTYLNRKNHPDRIMVPSYPNPHKEEVCFIYGHYKNKSTNKWDIVLLKMIIKVDLNLNPKVDEYLFSGKWYKVINDKSIKEIDENFSYQTTITGKLNTIVYYKL